MIIVPSEVEEGPIILPSTFAIGTGGEIHLFVPPSPDRETLPSISIWSLCLFNPPVQV